MAEEIGLFEAMYTQRALRCKQMAQPDLCLGYARQLTLS
jgi:hypothetical protein